MGSWRIRFTGGASPPGSPTAATDLGGCRLTRLQDPGAAREDARAPEGTGIGDGERGAGEAVAAEHWPLEWIDGYVVRLREFIVVREVDSLLIKVPNEAYKLNPSGIRVLRRLLEGESVLALWRSYGATEDVRRDLYEFFVGLKRLLQGCLDEEHLPAAVVARPFALGFSQLPVLSEVALTSRCNLRCRFCYLDADGEGGHEMSIEQIRRILDTIRHEAEVPSVSFTGGEPTLRRDLPDIVAYAHQTLGLRVNLITNGTRLTPEGIGDLKQAGLSSAQVSIESPDAAVHDGLTQVGGAHAASVAAVKWLREAGIRVHTNSTINRVNRGSVAAMPEFARSLGLERLSMNLVIPCGRPGRECQDVNLRYEEVGDLVLAVQAEAARCGVEFMWYSPTPVCLFNPVAHRLGNKGCAACDGLLSVSASGDVLPCSSWPEPVGNLLRQPFRQVWRSRRARRLREKRSAPRACRGCADFALCQGACPLYWRHFGYDELTHAVRARGL